MKAEVYKGKDGWRFRIRAVNGEIVAQSEGYQNKADAISTALKFGIEVEEIDDDADSG